jgi:type II secretory pathway component PulM
MASIAQPTAHSALAHWWRLRTRSERRILIAAIAVLGMLAAWFLVLQPIERDTARLGRQLATQGTMLAEARRQADDIATLSRNAPPVPSRDPRADVEAQLTRLGLKAAAIDRLDDKRLRVTIEAVAFDKLAALFQSLESDAHLRAVDVTATARVEPGQVRAEMTLAR